MPFWPFHRKPLAQPERERDAQAAIAEAHTAIVAAIERRDRRRRLLVHDGASGNFFEEHVLGTHRPPNRRTGAH